jgi:phosphatidate cytidylyltransferase
MLNQRLISGGVFGGAFLLAVFFLPAFCVGPVMMALVGFALWEFYGLLASAGVPSFRVIGTVTGMIWVGLSALGYLAPQCLPAFLLSGEAELFLLAVLMVGICIRMFPQKNNVQPLMTLACTVFGVLYVAFFLNYILKIVLAWETPDWTAPIGRTGRIYALFLVIVVKVTDIGAFFVGRSLGRHKMFPRISPGKSWEGLAGGLLSGVAIGLVLYGVFRLPGEDGVIRFGSIAMTGFQAGLLSLVLSGVGVLGDLVESLLKRATCAKDSGTLIPGMGGILDVLDSLLLGAPCLYYCLRALS